VLTPRPRGDLSATVLETLRGVPDSWPDALPPADGADDAALTLWAMYELHYRGFDDVDDAWEWHPGLLGARAGLERDFEAELRRRHASAAARPEGDLSEALFAYVAAHDGPSVSGFVQRRATRDQILELLRARSVYALRESDPTAWLVPRLGSQVQAALMSLQYDEYGGGDAARVHARLFARGLETSGLSPEFGTYLDLATTEVLEQNNAMSLLGRRMAQGLRRLDFPDEMVAYYEEHVEADAVHEQLAVREICAPLVADEPDQRDEVFFGAFVCLDSEARVAGRLLQQWGEAA